VTDVRAPQESTAAGQAAPEARPAGAGDDPGGPTAGGPAAVQEASRGWFRWAWRQLTSMRSALVLLFLLALGIIPGSLLPQQGLSPADVQTYFTTHPALAPWLNRLGLFNVFASPWFAAIYLLLFTSLIGCVVPRTFRLAGSARTPPPRAPRNLSRLPHTASYPSELPPADAIAVAAAMLGGKRFRLRKPADGDKTHWISAEKGYLREAGNLLFHLSLVGLLGSIALGGLFGYKADKIIVEGSTFSDSLTALDQFTPGRLVGGGNLAPFSVKLNRFSSSYYTSGAAQGSPSNYDAFIDYSPAPGVPARSYDLRINDPLNVDGTKVYLINDGFAPVFTVTDGTGRQVYQEATPFIPVDPNTLLSDGVVKVPDAHPAQLGFVGEFTPTASSVNGFLGSAFPEPKNPAVSMVAYEGDVGLDAGASQSVYQLDTTAMEKLTAQPFLLRPGGSYTLPNGRGKITFNGYKRWVGLAVTYDPGQLPALIFSVLILGGLLLSFLVRRRRVFVRSVARDGGSVVTVGGLARTDASGGFEDEFAELVTRLQAAHNANMKTGA
jgi:cytochrome c biogenesis protein